MILDSLPGWELVLFFALVIIFLISGGVTVFLILSKLRWPFTVNVLQDVDGSGKPKIVSKDRARLISFGDGGEEIFFLKKLRKFRVGYGKRIGNKVILWVIGEDGYWYNSTFGSLDKRLMEMGVMPVDRDMRFATASVRKGLEHRYNDKNFMDKYGAILYFGLFFMTMLIFGGLVWFMFSQQGKIAGANYESIQAAKQVMELAQQVLGSIDNIQSGGSGLVPS